MRVGILGRARSCGNGSPRFLSLAYRIPLEAGCVSVAYLAMLLLMSCALAYGDLLVNLLTTTYCYASVNASVEYGVGKALCVRLSHKPKPAGIRFETGDSVINKHGRLSVCYQ